MAEANPTGTRHRLTSSPNDGPMKALIVATLVALICAVVVSITAVTLKPLQEANIDSERQARMQQMLAGLPGLQDIVSEAGADSLVAVLVDLDSGAVVESADPASYDQRAAAADAETSVAIPKEDDLAGLGRRARHAPAYLVHDGKALSLVVLPVHGSGYQSTLYGYLALDGDLESVAALSFYEHGETPGIGSRIQDPAWEALWPGTPIADENGDIRIAVVRGTSVEPYEVDGISGATRTSDGVTNLLRFWLGHFGYGPFLERLANGEVVQ